VWRSELTFPETVSAAKERANFTVREKANFRLEERLISAHREKANLNN
jgi:hypothetical protein